MSLASRSEAYLRAAIAEVRAYLANPHVEAACAAEYRATLATLEEALKMRRQ